MSIRNNALGVLRETLAAVTAEIEVCDRSGCTEISEALNELKKTKVKVKQIIAMLEEEVS